MYKQDHLTRIIVSWYIFYKGCRKRLAFCPRGEVLWFNIGPKTYGVTQIHQMKRRNKKNTKYFPFVSHLKWGKDRTTLL